MGIGTLPIWGQVLAFIAGLVVLTKGADWMVEAASEVARRFGVSELVIGLTIIAMGTSAPEFAVSGTAAFSGNGGLSLGNVVGSNIFNLGFILGLCAMIRPLGVPKIFLYRDGTVLLVSVFLLSTMCLHDSILDRLEATILLSFFLIYIIYLIRSGRNEGQPVPIESIDDDDRDDSEKSTGFLLLIVAGGLAMLLLSSKVLVEIAVNMAQAFGMDEWLIGVTIIAVGTSLPELVTALTSLAKGKEGIGVGNLVGSDIFNILGVMGFAAMLHPIEVSPLSTWPILILAGAVVLLLCFMRSGWSLGRSKGLALILVSVGRWILEISS